MLRLSVLYCSGAASMYVQQTAQLSGWLASSVQLVGQFSALHKLHRWPDWPPALLAALLAPTPPGLKFLKIFFATLKAQEISSFEKPLIQFQRQALLMRYTIRKYHPKPCMNMHPIETWSKCSGCNRKFRLLDFALLFTVMEKFRTG